MNKAASEGGFTLVEMQVAGFLFSSGLLAPPYCFSQGVSTVMTSQQDSTARQKAFEAMEEVLTTRNTNTIKWERIENINNGAVFPGRTVPPVTPGRGARK
jgi:type II secretory pathway component PulJ